MGEDGGQMQLWRRKKLYNGFLIFQKFSDELLEDLDTLKSLA